MNYQVDIKAEKWVGGACNVLLSLSGTRHLHVLSWPSKAHLHHEGHPLAPKAFHRAWEGPASPQDDGAHWALSKLCYILINSHFLQIIMQMQRKQNTLSIASIIKLHRLVWSLLPLQGKITHMHGDLLRCFASQGFSNCLPVMFFNYSSLLFEYLFLNECSLQGSVWSLLSCT